MAEIQDLLFWGGPRVASGGPLSLPWASPPGGRQFPLHPSFLMWIFWVVQNRYLQAGRTSRKVPLRNQIALSGSSRTIPQFNLISVLNSRRCAQTRGSAPLPCTPTRPHSEITRVSQLESHAYTSPSGMHSLNKPKQAILRVGKLEVQNASNIVYSG